MTGSGITKRALLRLLEQAPGPLATPELMELVAGWPLEELPVAMVPSVEIRSIYRRRHAHIAETHPLATSIDHLLAALDSFDEPEVATVTIAIAGHVASVWLQPDLRVVLATMVGEDKRG